MARKPRQVIEYRVYELSMDFPVLLLDGDIWHISDVKSNRLHFHNCLEIGVCHSDSGILLVGEEPIEFRAGDVTCIPRHIPHTTYSSKGCSSLWSYIFVDLRELLSDMLRTTEDYELCRLLMREYIYHTGHSRYSKVHFLASAILDELRGKAAGYRASVRGLFIALFYELLRNIGEETAEERRSARKEALVLTPALDYINENYPGRIHVDRLADMCHLSATHFRRLFLSIMGTTPLHFINTTRVDRAGILLLTTDRPILEIAESVGFPSVSSFNRYFFNVMGVSPRDYRNPETRANIRPRHKNILQYSGWTEPDL